MKLQAALLLSEYGIYRKACYEQLDDIYGGVPIEPLTATTPAEL